jgi:hypothetical protein
VPDCSSSTHAPAILTGTNNRDKGRQACFGDSSWPGFLRANLRPAKGHKEVQEPYPSPSQQRHAARRPCRNTEGGCAESSCGERRPWASGLRVSDSEPTLKNQRATPSPSRGLLGSASATRRLVAASRAGHTAMGACSASESRSEGGGTGRTEAVDALARASESSARP